MVVVFAADSVVAAAAIADAVVEVAVAVVVGDAVAAGLVVVGLIAGFDVVEHRHLPVRAAAFVGFDIRHSLIHCGH